MLVHGFGGLRSRRMRASDANAASSRSVMRSSGMKPRSHALTVESSCRPMSVGDVRIATTGAGSSWKLSGASHAVSGPTKRSKKRQWSSA